MNYINFFERNLVYICFALSLILALLIVFIYPQLVVTHKVHCEDNITIFEDREEAITFSERCIKKDNNYINGEGINVYNGNS